MTEMLAEQTRQSDAAMVDIGDAVYSMKADEVSRALSTERRRSLSSDSGDMKAGDRLKLKWKEAREKASVIYIRIFTHRVISLRPWQ